MKTQTNNVNLEKARAHPEILVVALVATEFGLVPFVFRLGATAVLL